MKLCIPPHGILSGGVKKLSVDFLITPREFLVIFVE
jgi:hypothetical protein